MSGIAFIRKVANENDEIESDEKETGFRRCFHYDKTKAQTLEMDRKDG